MVPSVMESPIVGTWMVFTGIDSGIVYAVYCRQWGWDDEKVVTDDVDVHRLSLFETKDDDDDDVEESDRQHVVATSCF